MLDDTRARCYQLCIEYIDTGDTSTCYNTFAYNNISDDEYHNISTIPDDDLSLDETLSSGTQLRYVCHDTNLH